jgi:hypothetical protein
MVLKNFIRYLVNKFLKDYIEELDYEKLKLDLKNGKQDNESERSTLLLVVDVQVMSVWSMFVSSLKRWFVY